MLMNCARQTRASGMERKGMKDGMRSERGNAIYLMRNLKLVKISLDERTIVNDITSSPLGPGRRKRTPTIVNTNFTATTPADTICPQWPNRMILFIYRTCYFFINQKYAFYGRGEILFHRIGRALLSMAFIITFYCCCSNSSSIQ